MVTTAKRERPSYNPAMLRWARERRGQSIEEVAHRLKQKPERIAAWEEAREIPTVNQARALADLYNRSFIEFFLKEPPQLSEPSMVPDFRVHRAVAIDENQRALKEVQSWATAQRTNALDLFQELGEEPPAFPEHLFATVETRVENAAAEARIAMDFTMDAQLALTSQERAQFPNMLRRKLEQIGILTLKNSALGELGARGMCLVEFPLPTVVFGMRRPARKRSPLSMNWRTSSCDRAASSRRSRIPMKGAKPTPRRGAINSLRLFLCPKRPWFAFWARRLYVASFPYRTIACRPQPALFELAHMQC